MNCLHCQAPLPAASRRDRRYCNSSCRAWASYWRGRNGDPPPQPWQHEALAAEDPTLAAAARHARQLAEASGWSRTTLRGVLDGLTAVLRDLPSGTRVPMSEVRDRPHRDVSRPRLAEVVGDLGLLHDDSTAAVRARSSASPAGWPRDSPGQPAGGCWCCSTAALARGRGPRPRSTPTPQQRARSCKSGGAPTTTSGSHPGRHLHCARADVRLPAQENGRRTRSLFRFGKRHGLVFTDPAAGVRTPPIDPAMRPVTDGEIRAIGGLAVRLAQRLAVALAAEHAARTSTIRHLKLDDVDLPNRRISLAGHDQRLGGLTHRAMRAWLGHRRATWPHSPNPHVLISKRTALGTGPVCHEFVRFSLGDSGFSIDQIRADRILHEALTAGPDPLHLSLVFNLDHSTALRYAAVAEHLLSDELEQPPVP